VRITDRASIDLLYLAARSTGFGHQEIYAAARGSSRFLQPSVPPLYPAISTSFFPHFAAAAKTIDYIEIPAQLEILLIPFAYIYLIFKFYRPLM
jgi:hypothetical protein